MKKHLLVIFAALLSINLANAQCTPDPALANESFGLWPDSLATVYTCVGCGDHSRVVDLVTFTDTVITVEFIPGNPQDVTVYIDAFKITEVKEVPTNMTYGTNVENDTSYHATDAPWGIWYNGGDVPNQTPTQGCVYINGAEAEWNALAALANYGAGRGAVQLEIDVDARVAATDPDLSSVIQNGSWMSDVPPSFGGGPITVDDYWLVAQESSTGIVSVDKNQFSLLHNFPNPFDGTTNIMFNAPNRITQVDFNVYNSIGELVYTENIATQVGMNTHVFDGQTLSSGLYVYTLTDGVSTLTSKMNIK